MSGHDTPPGSAPPPQSVPPPPRETLPESVVAGGAPSAQIPQPSSTSPAAPASRGTLGAAPPVGARSTSPWTTLMASLTTAEKLILGGAVVIVLVDLIFAIIIQQYSFSILLWVAAVGGLAVAFARRRIPRVLPAPYERLLLVVGGLAVVVGAREIVFDLFRILRPPLGASPAYILGFIGLVVGVAAMGYGAWLIWRDSSARDSSTR